MNHVNHKHILIAVLILVALTIIGSIASEHEWIVSTKEEQSSYSNYLNPDTTKVNVTFEKAKEILISSNSEINSDSINGELINDSQYGIIWQLTSKTSDNGSVLGVIDSGDGTLLWIEITKGEISEKNNFDPNTAEVNVTLEEAKKILKNENENIVDDSITGSLNGLEWELNGITTNGKAVVISIDAISGDIIKLYDSSKDGKGSLDLNDDDALEIANEYVATRNSVDSINELELEEIKKSDSNTFYVSYVRIIKGIPSLSDGILLRVNSGTGEVRTYRKTWSMDENEVVVVSTEPDISSDEASEILKEYMANEPFIGKDKADTVKINSSSLVWKFDDNQTIHLAWWIRFKDSTFANEDSPAATWIDAHSGEIILFVYERD
ncbi:YcdB/YcdC domain-containing protein [Methanolobus profundi]|uniref:YcdB/YcdC repeated domain-containing protein n=1 Tax=Methanolobus profundi TaxID=487685 RepID=A0A1I4RDS7_9EURY|nr:YcdB/YcdC domain-containing protein [Methanolobus profundi]SFM50442.1 hypothetical protein SAMN04488696_1520 [Methanolobus profundi]